MSTSQKEHRDLILSCVRLQWYGTTSMQVCNNIVQSSLFSTYLFHSTIPACCQKIKVSCWFILITPLDVEFGRLQARDLLQHLWTGPISNASLDVVQGGRSVEVRAVGVSKVQAISVVLSPRFLHAQALFVLARTFDPQFPLSYLVFTCRYREQLLIGFWERLFITKAWRNQLIMFFVLGTFYQRCSLFDFLWLVVTFHCSKPFRLHSS